MPIFKALQVSTSLNGMINEMRTIVKYNKVLKSNRVVNILIISFACEFTILIFRAKINIQARLRKIIWAQLKWIVKETYAYRYPY